MRRDTTAENREYFRRELQAAMRDIRMNYESVGDSEGFFPIQEYNFLDRAPQSHRDRGLVS